MQIDTGQDEFAPLSEFYARAGVALPRVEAIEGDQMPSPYRELLVHNGDMTPTLEAHHKESLYLRVLDARDNGDETDHTLTREVVLLTETTHRPVEFGAICIHLDPFPKLAQREILHCRRPLGSILGDYDLGHTSSPSTFFRFMTDSIVREALQLERSQWLFGRCNVLSHHDGRPLAQVVEILPPARPGDGQ